MTSFRVWLERNYNLVHEISLKINKDIGEDVLHFTIDKFLNKDLTFLDNLEDHNKLKYLTKTIKLQVQSQTSQYYREVKKFSLLTKDVIIEEADDENDTSLEELQLFFIEQQLKKMNWFSSLMFKRYIETGYSAQKLADQLLIPLSTVQYHIRKVRTQIKNEWNKIDINKIL